MEKTIKKLRNGFQADWKSVYCTLLDENKRSISSSPTLATLSILNYTHLYGIFWWRWAKVSYNNFKQYPPV
jgi:hypothetical protein